MTESFDRAPEKLTLPSRLAIPAPINLADILGYNGTARFVGFSHEPYGDETFYEDGRISGTGNWHAFKTYREHPAVAAVLEPFHLGSSDEQSTHALVIDQSGGDVTALPWVAARPFLRSQHPKDGLRNPTDTWPKDLANQIEAMIRTTLSPTPAEIMDHIRYQREAEIALRDWLDQHLPRTE